MGKNKKISKSFIGFLVASVLIWFIITLSKNYTTTLTFPVVYNNIPQDKLLQKEPVKEIDIVVNASGFNILKARINNRTISLNARYLTRKTASKYYFLTNSQINNVQQQLKSGIDLHEIVLDTIYLDIGSLISKKVPVKPNLDINYHIGYDILESVKIKPDSIVISGPEAQIDKIAKVDLELLKLDDVKANFTNKVKIILPKEATDLKLNNEFVSIRGEVEKFTEGSFNIPFTIKNLPKDVELTTLNKTVEVVFIVGLSNFDKIDNNFFEVVCDYNISKENNLNYLLPKVISKSNLIKSYKVLPNKIDFLIQK